MNARENHRWSKPNLVLEHVETLHSLLLHVEPTAATRGETLSPEPLVIPGTNDGMFAPIKKKKKMSHKRKHKGEEGNDGKSANRRKEESKKSSKCDKAETISLAPPVKVIVPVYGEKPTPTASATVSVAPSSTEVTSSDLVRVSASTTPLGSVTHLIPCASVKAPLPPSAKTSRSKQPTHQQQQMPMKWVPKFILSSSDDDGEVEAKKSPAK